VRYTYEALIHYAAAVECIKTLDILVEIRINQREYNMINTNMLRESALAHAKLIIS
jgi:hypothetical protein